MKRVRQTIAALLLILPLHALADASDAVFNVFTYKADGNILASGFGFFVSADGEGVAAYSLFNNAYRAEVVDAKGKKHDVTRILGANSLADVVKIRVEVKKAKYLDIADAPADEGSAVELANYKGGVTPTLVKKVSDFNAHKFYDISAPNVERNFGCPLVSRDGRAVGIVQHNPSADASAACAIDARLVQTLAIGSTSSLNSDLNAIHIPKALPAEAKEALSYIYIMSKADTVSYSTALDDFIAAFPDNAEGFVNRGTFYAGQGKATLCEADFATALSKAGNGNDTMTPDAVHHTFGKLIYTSVVSGKPAAADWTLDRAAAEAETAYSIRPNPLYLLQLANCQYALKDFRKAFDTYSRVNASELASAESFFAAANSLLRAQGDSAVALQLLDSCINRLNKPYSKSNAAYLYSRAQLLSSLGRYRDAVFDLNEFEKAYGPANLTHNFYYMREQNEKRARMFKQALDDIRYAQSVSQEPVYYDYRLEEVLIWLQAGEYETTIAAAQALLKELPESADCHKILGIAYGELKDRRKALDHLSKAKALGAADADVYIGLYQ